MKFLSSILLAATLLVGACTPVTAAAAPPVPHELASAVPDLPPTPAAETPALPGSGRSVLTLLLSSGVLFLIGPTLLQNVSAKAEVREYAQGAAQRAVGFVANFLAPTVEVGTVTGQYKVYDEKHRFRIPKTRLAPGGQATVIGFDAKDAFYNVEPNALDFPVPKIVTEENEMINVLQEGADIIADVGALAHEFEVVDKALTAMGAGTAAVFNAAADPIRILDENILAVMKAAKMSGQMQIKVLMGATALLILKNHPKVTAKITNNPKGASNLQVDEELLSGMLLGKPQVRSTYSIYDAGAEGLAEDVRFILDSTILIFASKDQPNRFDPSFMKTFRLRGQFMVPGYYETPDKRNDVAKFDWSADARVTNAPAGKRLNVAEA
jgi:hypothetical protein